MFRNYTHTHFTYSATNKKVSSAVLAYTLGFFFFNFLSFGAYYVWNTVHFNECKKMTCRVGD